MTDHNIEEERETLKIDAKAEGYKGLGAERYTGGVQGEGKQDGYGWE